MSYRFAPARWWPRHRPPRDVELANGGGVWLDHEPLHCNWPLHCPRMTLGLDLDPFVRDARTNGPQRVARSPLLVAKIRRGFRAHDTR